MARRRRHFAIELLLGLAVMVTLPLVGMLAILAMLKIVLMLGPLSILGTSGLPGLLAVLGLQVLSLMVLGALRAGFVRWYGERIEAENGLVGVPLGLLVALLQGLPDALRLLVVMALLPWRVLQSIQRIQWQSLMPWLPVLLPVPLVMVAVVLDALGAELWLVMTGPGTGLGLAAVGLAKEYDLPQRMMSLKERKLTAFLASNRLSKGEDWVTSLGRLIPRTYRDAVLGDIFEDCADMRDENCSEWWIKTMFCYQWAIAVVTLVPTAIRAWVVDLVEQVIRR